MLGDDSVGWQELLPYEDRDATSSVVLARRKKALKVGDARAETVKVSVITVDLLQDQYVAAEQVVNYETRFVSSDIGIPSQQSFAIKKK